MIPSLLADRVAYVALREALEQRAEATADLFYYKHLIATQGESARPAYERASHRLAKAEGYMRGVVDGLRVRYEEDEVRQFVIAAASELGDSGIVREGDLPSTEK